MITARGHKIDFSRPDQLVMDFEDFRIHTSNTCRYNGALDWKLVRHLWLTGELLRMNYVDNKEYMSNYKDVDPAELKAGFSDPLIALGYAHDLHEIYVGDMVSGLKKHCSEYCSVENIWETEILTRLGLHKTSVSLKDLVKWADYRALYIEMESLGHPAAPLIQSKAGGTMTEKETAIFKICKQKHISSLWTGIERHLKATAKGLDHEIQLSPTSPTEIINI